MTICFQIYPYLLPLNEGKDFKTKQSEEALELIIVRTELESKPLLGLAALFTRDTIFQDRSRPFLTQQSAG